MIMGEGGTWKKYEHRGIEKNTGDGVSKIFTFFAINISLEKK